MQSLKKNSSRQSFFKILSVFTVAVQLITSSSALEFWRLRMLGELITRYLVLLFGYAFPAFECFRSVEKNKVDVEEIKFWCQYWIIIALVTVCERIGDAFLSWLPMYGEVKLAFFYLPMVSKNKGNWLYLRVHVEAFRDKA
ncbi:hypothetical protein OIU85_000591 [Salix viminalis]|uniref:HVA22-like protein n=1 Tax=Salix viminalis TaxID=40686 RepID=A0A9Q0ZX68_SALVM|nr:hypothetical protein OIU85_000591 [Salix viminalis]